MTKKWVLRKSKGKSKSKLMKEAKRRKQNAEAVRKRIITGKFPFNAVKAALLNKLLVKREKQ